MQLQQSSRTAGGREPGTTRCYQSRPTHWSAGEPLYWKHKTLQWEEGDSSTHSSSSATSWRKVSLFLQILQGPAAASMSVQLELHDLHWKTEYLTAFFPLFLKSTSPQLSIQLPSGLPQLFLVNHGILIARREPIRRISSQKLKEHEATWNHMTKEMAISQQAQMQNKVNIFCTVTPKKSICYT